MASAPSSSDCGICFTEIGPDTPPLRLLPCNHLLCPTCATTVYIIDDTTLLRSSLSLTDFDCLLVVVIGRDHEEIKR
jgi:hypothetical protein